MDTGFSPCRLMPQGKLEVTEWTSSAFSSDRSKARPVLTCFPSRLWKRGAPSVWGPECCIWSRGEENPLAITMTNTAAMALLFPQAQPIVYVEAQLLPAFKKSVDGSFLKLCVDVPGSLNDRKANIKNGYCQSLPWRGTFRPLEVTEFPSTLSSLTGISLLSNHIYHLWKNYSRY